MLIIATGLYIFKDTWLNLLSSSDSSANPQAQSNLATQNRGPRGSAAVKVMTEIVEVTENSKSFTAIGTGRAIQTVDIYPTTNGEVFEIKFNSGEKVKKGDILIQLDDREERLALDLAQVNLNKNENILRRYEKASSAIAEINVEAARANYDAAKIAYEQAKLNLENKQIKTPIDGIAGILNINLGDKVNSNTLIVGVDNRSSLYIDFEIPENLVRELREKTLNSSFSVSTPAFPNLKLNASLNAISNRINTDERTLMVRAIVDNSEDHLKPGMSFEVNWQIAGESYPTIPEVALQWEREGAYIWLIRQAKAVKQRVEVITRSNNNVLVTGDFILGDRVVVEGIQRLRDGLSVEILR